MYADVFKNESFLNTILKLLKSEVFSISDSFPILLKEAKILI